MLLSEQPGAAAGARRTLLAVLETLLRLLHPLMPFITEEIWLRLAPLAGIGGESIVLAAWPHADEFPADPTAEVELRWVMQVVLAIRQIRGEMDIAPSRRLPLLLQDAGERELSLLPSHEALMSHLAGLASLRVLRGGESPPPAASAMVGELTLLVPMLGLIEPGSELQRLQRLMQKIEQELANTRAKLGNENFVRNAPSEVVAQERERLTDRERQRHGLTQQIEQVRRLL